MAEDLAQRVARMEGVLEQSLPMWKGLDEKMDKVLEALQDKPSKGALFAIQLQLERKADREDVDRLKLTFAKWSAIGGAVLFVLSVFGKSLVDYLFK